MISPAATFPPAFAVDAININAADARNNDFIIFVLPIRMGLVKLIVIDTCATILPNKGFLGDLFYQSVDFTFPPASQVAHSNPSSFLALTKRCCQFSMGFHVVERAVLNDLGQSGIKEFGNVSDRSRQICLHIIEVDEFD